MPQPWQSWIQAASATYPAACGNVGYLTHWARPGIALLSSHILGRVLKPLSHNRNSLGVLNIVDTSILLVIFMLQMFLLVSCFFHFMFLLLFWPHPQHVEVSGQRLYPHHSSKWPKPDLKPSEPHGTPFFFFGCVRGLWKFPGQGWSLCHSCNQSQRSNKARSLTCWGTR